MKQLEVDEETNDAFLYEPQLARDMKASGWKLKTSRSEVVGEFAGTFLKIIQDQEHRTGVLVTIMYPKPVIKFFTGNFDNQADDDIGSKGFKSQFEALSYEVATIHRDSINLMLLDTQNIRQVLEKVKRDLPALKSVLAAACKYAVRKRNERAKDFIEGVRRSHKALQCITPCIAQNRGKKT